MLSSWVPTGNKSFCVESENCVVANTLNQPSVPFFKYTPPFCFGIDLLAYVGVGPKPADHIAGIILHRHAASEKRTEAPIRAAQRKHHLEWLAGCDRGTPAFENGRETLGIVNRLPAPTRHRFSRRACVLVPPLVVPVDPAVRLCHPGKLRHGIGQLSEFVFGVSCFSFCL